MGSGTGALVEVMLIEGSKGAADSMSPGFIVPLHFQVDQWLLF